MRIKNYQNKEGEDEGTIEESKSVLAVLCLSPLWILHNALEWSHRLSALLAFNVDISKFLNEVDPKAKVTFHSFQVKTGLSLEPSLLWNFYRCLGGSLWLFVGHLLLLPFPLSTLFFLTGLFIFIGRVNLKYNNQTNNHCTKKIIFYKHDRGLNLNFYIKNFNVPLVLLTLRVFYTLLLRREDNPDWINKKEQKWNFGISWAWNSLLVKF